MLQIILDFVFSVQYLMLGVTIAALLDMTIHYTKSSSRFTFLEIWGCIMFWPLVLIVFVVALTKRDDN